MILCENSREEEYAYDPFGYSGVEETKENRTGCDLASDGEDGSIEHLCTGYNDNSIVWAGGVFYLAFFFRVQLVVCIGSEDRQALAGCRERFALFVFSETLVGAGSKYRCSAHISVDGNFAAKTSEYIISDVFIPVYFIIINSLLFHCIFFRIQ